MSGTLAVAAGFLLKDVAESIMAAEPSLSDGPLQVGDRIRFEEYHGEVEDIGVRSVRVVSPDDDFVTTSSGRFPRESVSSSNVGELECMLAIPFDPSPHFASDPALVAFREAGIEQACAL